MNTNRANCYVKLDRDIKSIPLVTIVVKLPDLQFVTQLLVSNLQLLRLETTPGSGVMWLSGELLRVKQCSIAPNQCAVDKYWSCELVPMCNYEMSGKKGTQCKSWMEHKLSSIQSVKFSGKSGKGFFSFRKVLLNPLWKLLWYFSIDSVNVSLWGTHFRVRIIIVYNL